MMGSQPIKRFSFLSFFLCVAKYKSFAIFTVAPPRWGTSHTHHVAILKHIKWRLHKAPQGGGRTRGSWRVVVAHSLSVLLSTDSIYAVSFRQLSRPTHFTQHVLPRLLSPRLPLLLIPHFNRSEKNDDDDDVEFKFQVKG